MLRHWQCHCIYRRSLWLWIQSNLSSFTKRMMTRVQWHYLAIFVEGVAGGGLKVKFWTVRFLVLLHTATVTDLLHHRIRGFPNHGFHETHYLWNPWIPMDSSPTKSQTTDTTQNNQHTDNPFDPRFSGHLPEFPSSPKYSCVKVEHK